MVGLQALSLCSLHGQAEILNTGLGHGVTGKPSFFKQVQKVTLIHGPIHGLEEAGLDVLLLSVLDGLKQKILQCILFKQFAEHVVDTSLQGLAGSLKFFQQASIDLAFASVFCHQIPKMADFNLTNPVNASKALLNFIGIPWQTMVDHQVAALEVHPFAIRIVGNENQQVAILHEPLYHLAPCLTRHTTMDDRNCVRPSLSCLNFLP